MAVVMLAAISVLAAVVMALKFLIGGVARR